jgi:two-component system response regulator AtoC
MPSSQRVDPELGTAGSVSSGQESNLIETNQHADVLPPISPHILVIDDEVLLSQQLERLFLQRGFEVDCVHNAEDALTRLESGNIDLIVTDIFLPGQSGVELTRIAREAYPDVPIIVMTGFAEIGSAVEVLKLGASDYIVKPFSAAAIQESVENVLAKARVFVEIRHLRQNLKDRCEFGGMLSRTPEMHRVFEIIRMVSTTDMTVVVEGETGTGKELVASAIHHQGGRRKGPFVTINCAGLPDTLLESELFGYEKGAFTGADQARPGKIELAHGGTLFLDEIESMPLAMQAKLLLVLQNQRVQRLGSTRWSQIDMRVIAATNVPLKSLVDQGLMRSDFYYRINVIPIHLLPLRNRIDDLPLLVQDFIHHHPLAKQKGINGISRPVLNHLMRYDWPGNIREVHNVLERAIVMTKGRTIEEVETGDHAPLPQNYTPEVSADVSLDEWLKEQEKQFLIQRLQALGGRINLTAKSCGIDVKSLYRKMRFHGLDKKVFKQQDATDSQETPHRRDTK